MLGGTKNRWFYKHDLESLQFVGLKTNLKKSLKKTDRSVNQKVKICVECGSIRTMLNEKSITCLDCGTKRKFKQSIMLSPFKKGDNVRIIDSEKNSKLIYNIKKMKKSDDGTVLYLLKSDDSAITLLYNESKESHLEKVD